MFGVQHKSNAYTWLNSIDISSYGLDLIITHGNGGSAQVFIEYLIERKKSLFWKMAYDQWLECVRFYEMIYLDGLTSHFKCCENSQGNWFTMLTQKCSAIHLHEICVSCAIRYCVRWKWQNSIIQWTNRTVAMNLRHIFEFRHMPIIQLYRIIHFAVSHTLCCLSLSLFVCGLRATAALSKHSESKVLLPLILCRCNNNAKQ